MYGLFVIKPNIFNRLRTKNADGISPKKLPPESLLFQREHFFQASASKPQKLSGSRQFFRYLSNQAKNSRFQWMEF